MRTTIMDMPRFVLVFFILALAGCGGTGDTGLSLDGGSDTPSDTGVGGDTSQGNAPFLILDLTTGASVTVAAIDDLASNVSYRSGRLVFKRVKGPTSEFWMGVFEISQAQWRNLAGASNTPWTEVDATLVGASAIADDMPAFNLSYTRVQTALGSFNAVHGTKLAIPNDAQWTDGCAAGGSGIWSWGDAHDRAVIATYAAVFETQSGVMGSRAVGSRQPNAVGLYDMHGNVWELTSPSGAIRGGSWRDSVVLARTDNHPSFNDTGVAIDTTHALLGVRLIIQP